ncbi:3-oxoadipate enol-lactonase [Isoptericola jiangsuensis]|uniref:3-oxoadipate enol-lactonase n=1 Tax=Isoptericola jiangsuensis TaxID=548579 RepID=UPI0038685593
MAFLELDTHTLHYRIDGEHGPWLMFCNSLGTDLHMWDEQVAALAGHFRILRYDRRGHGESSAPPAPYALADLGADALALMDAFHIERTAFCGLSIGGLVAQWLAINAPQRLSHVVVCASAARIGSEESWRTRALAVAAHGLAPLRAATAERWFGDAFRRDAATRVGQILDSFEATSVAGYLGCCAALGAADLHAQLGQIHVPLLAIAGDDDAVCPPSDLQHIAERTGGALEVLPGRHLVNVESAAGFSAALQRFLL